MWSLIHCPFLHIDQYYVMWNTDAILISICHFLFFLNTCISNANVNARLLLLLLRSHLSYVSRKQDGGQRVCDKAIFGLVHRVFIVISRACVAVRSVYIPSFPFSFATFKTKKRIVITTLLLPLLSQANLFRAWKIGNQVHRRTKTITNILEIGKSYRKIVSKCMDTIESETFVNLRAWARDAQEGILFRTRILGQGPKMCEAALLVSWPG